MTSRRLATRVLAAILAAVIAAVLLGGCGATAVSGTPLPAGATPATDTTDASAGAASRPSDGGPDVCSFFTTAEVKALIGIDTETLPVTLPDGTRECGWQNPAGDDENRSMLISVGAPGSAPGGSLPPQEGSVDLPGGLRRIANIVSFVCGGSRVCSISVTGRGTGRDEQVRIASGLVDRVRTAVGG